MSKANAHENSGNKKGDAVIRSSYDSPFAQEGIEDVFFIFMLGLQKLDNISLDQAALNAKSLISDLSDSLNGRHLHGRRESLIPHELAENLSPQEQDIYIQCIRYIHVYFYGDYSGAINGLRWTHIRLLSLQPSVNWAFLSVVIAHAYMLLGDHQEASFLCVKALTDVRFPEASPVHAAALTINGDIAYMKGLYAIASLRFHEAQVIWRKLSMLDKWSIAQADIARLHFIGGNYVRAFAAISIAKKYAQEISSGESLAYCQLTEIELCSAMRESRSSERAFLEYTQNAADHSAFHNSLYEKLVFSTYYIERHQYDEGVIELLSASVILKALSKNEYSSDVMIKLARYCNLEGLYDDALYLLIECFDTCQNLTTYRHALFLRWLDAMEVSLRGKGESNLAERVLTLINQFWTERLARTDNSVLAKPRLWLNLTHLHEIMRDIRGLQPRTLHICGLRFDLSSGEIFKENEIEKCAQFTDDQLGVFRMFAINPGVFFNNRDIIRALEPGIAEMKKPPRRDSYYIPLFRDLFRRLCGKKIFENRRGLGWRIPKR